jgi:hypothetical protein
VSAAALLIQVDAVPDWTRHLASRLCTLLLRGSKKREQSGQQTVAIHHLITQQSTVNGDQGQDASTENKVIVINQGQPASESPACLPVPCCDAVPIMTYETVEAPSPTCPQATPECLFFVLLFFSRRNCGSRRRISHLVEE